jgi:adenine-specific DNA-methyltransferase
MAKKKRTAKKTVETLRHGEASRKNIPTAEHQSVMNAEEQTPIRVAYERRDRDLDPQLVWRGKDCQDWSDLVVHAPPLYIQEKVHPKVLIDDLMRRTREQERAEEEEKQPTLFADLYADFNGLPDDARSTDFYQHDANWTNRMILGDSLQVMASLAEREGLRGQVQCIYLDPPYGIKFNSNFQWSTTSRDVKDGKADHITREPEQVKAFRDTWRDGIHSYLTYLRDRLTVARDLLHETGSIFVQIGDENVHRVRALMDEVFGEDNFCSIIQVQKTGSQAATLLANTVDFIVWFAKKKPIAKYRQIYDERVAGHVSSDRYDQIELEDGTERRLTREELARQASLPDGRIFRHTSLISSGQAANEQVFIFQGRKFQPGPSSHWKTTIHGLAQLAKASRVAAGPSTVRYKRYIDDFSVLPITDRWESLQIGTGLIYVVQTATSVVERCIQMATDPGDLVLDPTCGSGTTAYVAEQWGRRWITIDTSRVSLALARARIMGARYPFYLLADSREGQKKEAEVASTVPSSQPVHGNIRHGFVYERVPHITLKSIANNAEIDVIWEQWQARLEPLRGAMNKALGKKWEEWEIPREVDAKWSNEAKSLHADWWKARIARQKDIDASIAARAEFEYLYDKPYEDKKKVRVAGPFTVESLTPHRVLGVDEDDELIDGVADADSGYGEEQSFVQMILENLKAAGVQQAHKEDKITFTSISPWPGELVCATGNYIEGDEKTGAQKRAAIFVGPEFGTVSRPDLVAAAREAGDAGFDALIACAFNYDAHSSEFSKLGRIPVLKARMNADLHMADDLKNTGKGNLFVIFGEPDIEVACGQWLVAKNGRKVANYEFVKELSGLGRLEEINRLGREDLPRLKQLSRDGAVRADESVTAGRGVGAVEHRRGSGADRDRGIPAKPERRSGVAGGGGDAVDSGGASGDAAAARDGGAADRGGHHQPYAGRAEAVAAIQSLTETDFPLSLTTDHRVQVTIHGVDVFHPNTGEVRSDGAEGIACWFIDTDYNEESFFVRQAYFLGANDPYKSLKTTLKAEINEDAWETLHSDTSRPFNKPQSGRIAVKVINHLGDEVMKVFRVE